MNASDGDNKNANVLDGELKFVELDTSPQSQKLLGEFYDQVFVPCFPDPDERISLQEMQNRLKDKEEGRYYGEDNTHIVLATVDGKVVGGRVLHYIADANVGYAEYRCVSEEYRKYGIGGKLTAHTDKIVKEDAIKQGKTLTHMVGEMNDPYDYDGPETLQQNEDRVKAYSKVGWHILDCPYYQAPLSKEQEPVKLMLICKSIDKQTETPPTWSAAHVGQITTGIGKMLRGALDAENFKENAAEMQARANEKTDVRCFSLGEYTASIDGVRQFKSADKHLMATEQKAVKQLLTQSGSRHLANQSPIPVQHWPRQTFNASQKFNGQYLGSAPTQDPNKTESLFKIHSTAKEPGYVVSFTHDSQLTQQFNKYNEYDVDASQKENAQVKHLGPTANRLMRAVNKQIDAALEKGTEILEKVKQQNSSRKGR